MCRNSLLCTKFYQNRTIYHRDMAILHYFQNDGRQLSWIFEILSFCHMTFVGMLFCFLLQNFTEIGQSFDKLCQTTIFTMTAVRHLKFWRKKMFLVMRLSSSSLSATDYSVPSLIKIGRFITDNVHFVMNSIVKKIKIGQYFSQCYERTSSGTFYGVLYSIHGICLLNPTKNIKATSKIALLRTACGRGQSYLALSLAS